MPELNDKKFKIVKDDKKTNDGKIELANRIAFQSQKVANTYQHVEDVMLRAVRWFSSLIDRTLFNRRYTKIVALVLAVLMYLIVNYDSNAALRTSQLNYSRTLYNVAVSAKYNIDTFELNGLDQTCNITIIGDASSVTSAANSSGVIVANLEGLTEGTHEVKLTPEGFGVGVEVKVEPSVSVVTLKKKTTQQFDLSYDFIHQDKMDSIYSVGVPTFEYTKVNVRASKDTLSSIAFVKALIDVKGQTSEFTQDAALVAYDTKGQPVNADIVPSSISVTVPITSPNKTVPIEVKVSGDVPDGKAISNITMDQQSVTVYGSESVLGQIDKVIVTLNASTISKDESTILRPITLPSGVNSSNINQITMTVTLGEGVQKQIDDVKISYKNNIHNYKASQPQNKTTTSIVLFGTQENVDAVSIENINVYVDMKDAKPGIQNFALQVDQPSNGLVKYSLMESTYELNVLGETTENQTGEDVNNG